MNTYFKEASQEIKKLRTLTAAGLLTAITVVIDYFRIVLTQTMEITFSFLGVAITGMLYGPVVGGIVGAAADTLEYLIRPSGAYFFGFTVNKIATGVIFGLFLYKRIPTLKRAALAVLTENIIVSLILTPLWLNIMYGTTFFVIERIIRTVVLYPINVALLYVVCKSVKSIRMKSGVV